MTPLHSAEDAIKQAVKAGYQRIDPIPGVTAAMAKDGPYLSKHGLEKILLDPLFWQALGKARGWKNSTFYEVYVGGTIYGEWMRKALDYFETVLSGGDIQKYFESLP